MNPQPGKFMTSLPAILGAFGAILAIVGTGYETAAQHDPNIPAILGWPAGLTGLLTTAGAFFVSLSNQKKAGSALPEAPVDADGEKIDDVTHMVSLAVARAMQMGDPDLAGRLNDAMKEVSTGLQQGGSGLPPAPVRGGQS